MRLTVYLLKHMPHRFRGKHRIVKDPKYIDLLRLRHDLEREEKNMLLLRHPYLTCEQSYGHMKDSKKPVFSPSKIGQMIKNEKYAKQITIADRLNHFRIAESWD